MGRGGRDGCCGVRMGWRGCEWLVHEVVSVGDRWVLCVVELVFFSSVIW